MRYTHQRQTAIEVFWRLLIHSCQSRTGNTHDVAKCQAINLFACLFYPLLKMVLSCWKFNRFRTVLYVQRIFLSSYWLHWICCFAHACWRLSNFLLRFLQHFAISSSVGEESVCSDHLSSVFSDTAPENIKPESKKKVKYICMNVTQSYII